MMSVQEIIDYIEQLGKEYVLKHGISPNYVKIPMYVYYAFEAVKKMICAYVGDDDVEVKKVAGLTVCPTVSIEKIEEIEVF